MKKTQPTVRWEKYIRLSSGNYVDYLINHGNSFLQKITTNLIKAHRSKDSKLILFTFRNSNIVCSVYYHEYVTILKRIMSLCEKLEYYEICAQILKYFKQFQQTDKQLYKSKIIKTHGREH
jgi:hypothetical protein